MKTKTAERITSIYIFPWPLAKKKIERKNRILNTFHVLWETGHVVTGSLCAICNILVKPPDLRDIKASYGHLFWVWTSSEAREVEQDRKSDKDNYGR